jgi:GDP-mannose 6-dehydrogenase
VRESPFVKLVERLLTRGCDVRILDPNVQLSRLLGANRDYLFRVLPRISELMVADASEVLHWAEVIVVTAPDPRNAALIAESCHDRIILDFSFEGLGGRPGQVEGFLW